MNIYIYFFFFTFNDFEIEKSVTIDLIVEIKIIDYSSGEYNQYNYII